MLAMNYRGPFRVRIDEKPYPEILHPKDAILIGPKLIKHVMDGVLNPKAIITHWIPLREISEAYRMFSGKLDNMIKPVLIPETSF